MAKLQRLTISGVRSFGPDADEVQHVKFNDTVTLFLGQNGCGKTTILECVKYALSGDLPAGCSSGQGFVSDPSIRNSVETKGQIRLKISDGAGRHIVIIRSMQVTKQRAGGLRFKALDSMVEEEKDGAKRQFSGRLADINNYCSDALQVSPCILNNVLLCHQENSAWPLEEGKRLKEKFDEIFESTRYNKCVELLRKQLKGNKDRLKVLTVERQYKREDKERVDKLRVRTCDKKAEYEGRERDVEAKQNELIPIETRLQEIGVLEEGYGRLERALATKEATRAGIVEQQNAIKRNVETEFVGTDTELTEKIRTFEAERRQEEEKVAQLERNKGDIEKRGRETNVRMQTLHGELGRLREEKRRADAKVAERRQLIEKAKIHLKLEARIGEYDADADAGSVIDVLNEEMDARRRALDDKIEERRAEERALQRALDEVRERQVGVRQAASGKGESLQETERRMGDLQNELHDLETSNKQLDVLLAKIASIDKDVASLKRSFDETEFASQIDRDKAKLAKMETERTDLDQEYRRLQKNVVLLEKVDSAREMIVQKQAEINKLNGKHSSAFEELFGKGDGVPPSPLQPAVRSRLQEEEARLRGMQQKMADKQKEVTTLHAKVQHQTDKIDTHRAELATKKKQIRDVCKGKTFEEAVAKAAADRRSYQSDKALYASMKVVYEKFVSQFQSPEPCCPVCRTNFKNKTQLTAQIVTRLREEIANAPRFLPELEQKAEAADELHNRLQQLKPVDESVRLVGETTLPALEDELQEMRMALAGADGELATIAEKMAPCQRKIDACRGLASDAALLDQHRLEIDRCGATVADVEGQLARAASDKSLAQIEAELDTLTFDLADLRKKVDTDNQKLNRHRTRLQDLRDDRSRLVDRQLECRTAVQARPEKERQLAEAEEKVKSLKIEIDALNKQLVTVKTELAEAQKNKEQYASDSARIVDDLRAKLAANTKLVDDIARVHESHVQYVRDKKEERLQRLEGEVQTLQTQEQNIRTAGQKILRVISEKREELAKRQTRFRELEDNRSLREKRREERTVQAEIDELRRQLGSRDLEGVRAEKRALAQRYEEIDQGANVMRGQLRQLRVEIDELEADLARPANRRAYDEYRDKAYEVAVVTAATDDLQLYVGVLERSILEFHKDKMKRINRCIRELWRNIYRGNDIDYIEIKTEDGGAGGAGNRRSYNYKVVQVKRAVELEMRGRCSAGQKVLACLVIRMALAEIFSSKCGILALDEPTTNLDRENIVSLSDSLSRIVSDRQQQTNFQLLIITHDEDFLDTLKRVQSVSSYYRVKRNENGNSVVSREHL